MGMPDCRGDDNGDDDDAAPGDAKDNSVLCSKTLKPEG